MRVDGVQPAADAGHALQRVGSLGDDRPPLCRRGERRDAQTSARRVEIGVDEQRVADHLHVVDRSQLGRDRDQRVVGQAQQIDLVGVNEVPSGQHREPAALAHADRAPGVAFAIIREHASSRRCRPEPMVVDDRRVARRVARCIEESARVGPPRERLVVDATRPVGQQLAAVDVEHVDHRAGTADGLAERDARAVGRGHGKRENVAVGPPIRIEHRLERRASRSPHPQHQPLVIAAGLPHELAFGRGADGWRQPRVTRRARDRRAQPVTRRHRVQDRPRDRLLGGDPRPRVDVGESLEPSIRLVEPPAVERVRGVWFA